MTLRRGVRWGDGIVLRPDVNIRSGKRRGIRRGHRAARPRADPRCGCELAAEGFGATRAEVEEALGVCVYMGGGPSLMYAADALAAFEHWSLEETVAA